ncbi:hypothetical protein CDAR_583801 [Caerostris darwini]|uniref:Uncharacterized protein n=1 Tax=Caerostris darwini TaxID=1538125 RepID=A0AAV4RIX0_9ARAC|nr:hypothetical protein CDAR_583801 [Caerostris darwini]
MSSAGMKVKVRPLDISPGGDHSNLLCQQEQLHSSNQRELILDLSKCTNLICPDTNGNPLNSGEKRFEPIKTYFIWEELGFLLLFSSTSPLSRSLRKAFNTSAKVASG